jgi:hypothetical protein
VNKNAAFVILAVLTVHLAYGDELLCERWFFKNGLTPGTGECELACGTSSVGMDAFMCPQRCGALCSTTIPAFILKRLTYPSGLTKSDKDLIGKHPNDALWVFFSKTSAERATARLFGTNGWNDEGDAFRHFMWASLTTLKIGPDKARLFLENHERRPGQSKAEAEMDSHNNEQGVVTATQLQKTKTTSSQETLERQGLKLLEDGKLKVITPKGVTPKWQNAY